MESTRTESVTACCRQSRSRRWGAPLFARRLLRDLIRNGEVQIKQQSAHVQLLAQWTEVLLQPLMAGG